MNGAGGLRGKRGNEWVTGVAVTALVIATVGPGAHGFGVVLSHADALIEAELSAELGSKFAFRRSEHFILAHRLEERLASEVLGWMEMTYGRVLLFCSDNRLATSPIDRRMVSVCIPRPSVGGDGGGGGAPAVQPLSGFYDLAMKRSYFDAEWLVRGVRAGAPSILEEAARVTVQHEIAHQSLDLLCPTISERMPDWLAEGLACSFEVAGEAGVTGFRQPNPWRLKDAIGCLSPGEQASSRRSACVIERVLRDEAGTRYHWESGSGAADGRSDASSRSPTWYAASWAVVFYLQTERPESFRAYLHSLMTSPAIPSASEHARSFERFFGPIDTALRVGVLEALERVRGESLPCGPPAGP